MGAFGEPVPYQHLILGRDKLADGGEVAGSSTGNSAEAELAPDEPEDSTQQGSRDQEADLPFRTEDQENDTDEQPEPETGTRPGDRRFPRVRRPVTRSTDRKSVPTIARLRTSKSWSER